MRSFTDAPTLPPGYVYSTGVARLLDWERSTVYAQRAALPDPVFKIDGRLVWREQSIRDWRAQRRPRLIRT